MDKKISGHLSVSIRKLTPDDLPFCMKLVREVSWNQTENDWLRAMDLDPEGCFMGEADNQPVATTTTCRFDDVAWIAMVLVDKSVRGQGVGQRMLEYAIEHLDKRGVKTIRLDATSMGRGLYTKLGFRDEYEVIRYARDPASVLNECDGKRDDVSDDIFSTEIPPLDYKVTSTHREKLLFHLVKNNGSFFELGLSDTGESDAYAAVREGTNAVQLGPAIALTPISGKLVLDSCMMRLNHQRIFIDIPSENSSAVGWAVKNGFVEQRRFIRMFLGEKVHDHPQMIWASFGPEKG